MDEKKAKNHKTSRYSNSVIYYKNISCRVSIYEDRAITDFCIKNNLSKSMFMSAAAMYCVKNEIKPQELLASTATPESFDYRDYPNDADE